MELPGQSLYRPARFVPDALAPLYPQQQYRHVCHRLVYPDFGVTISSSQRGESDIAWRGRVHARHCLQGLFSCLPLFCLLKIARGFFCLT